MRTSVLMKLDKDVREVFSAVPAWHSHVDASELSKISEKSNPALRAIRDARDMAIDVACR